MVESDQVRESGENKGRAHDQRQAGDTQIVVCHENYYCGREDDAERKESYPSRLPRRVSLMYGFQREAHFPITGIRLQAARAGSRDGLRHPQPGIVRNEAF